MSGERPMKNERPECLGLRSVRNGGNRISVSFWGCICYSGVGLHVLNR